MRPVHGGRAVLRIRATSLRVPLAVAMSRGWNLAASALAQFFGREQLLGHCPPDPQPPAGPPPPTLTASCLADKTRKPHCPRPLAWPPRGQRNHRMPSEMRGLGHSLPEGPAAGPAPPQGASKQPTCKGGLPWGRLGQTDTAPSPEASAPSPGVGPSGSHVPGGARCPRRPLGAQERGYQRDPLEGRPRCPGPRKAADARAPASGPHARRVGSGRVRWARHPGPGRRAAWDSHSPFCLQASVRKKKGKGRARVCVQPPPARPAGGPPCVAVGVASPCAVTLCCVPRVGPLPDTAPCSLSRLLPPSRLCPPTCPHLVTAKPAGPSAVTARPALRAAAAQGAGQQRAGPLAMGRATP